MRDMSCLHLKQCQLSLLIISFVRFCSSGIFRHLMWYTSSQKSQVRLLLSSEVPQRTHSVYSSSDFDPVDILHWVKVCSRLQGWNPWACNRVLLARQCMVGSLGYERTSLGSVCLRLKSWQHNLLSPLPHPSTPKIRRRLKFQIIFAITVFPRKGRG